VLGDRIGVMRDGKLLQLAPPHEIYNRPSELFVANFTGATNELAGKVVSNQGEHALIDLGDGNRIVALRLQPLEAGASARIAIRPENITLGAKSETNTFPVSILDRRYQGTQTVYDVDLLGRKLESLELGTAARFEPGTQTTAYLGPDVCWSFNDTGPSKVE